MKKAKPGLWVADAKVTPGTAVTSVSGNRRSVIRGRGRSVEMRNARRSAGSSSRTRSDDLLIVRQSFLAILSASGFRPGLWGTRRLNHVSTSFNRLNCWLDRTARGSGRGYLLAVLKQVAADARLSAICGAPVSPRLRGLLRLLPTWFNTRNGLDQLSYLGRALPPGDKRVVRVALEKHREAASTPFTVSPSLVKYAKDFAEGFALRHLLGVDPGEEAMPVSCGATLTNPRRKGGMREQLRTTPFAIRPRLSKPGPPGALSQSDLELTVAVSSTSYRRGEVPVYPEMEPLPISCWEVWPIDKTIGPPAVLWQAARRLSGTDMPPENRVCCLAERGFKARIVSAPSLDAAIAGGALNRVLLRSLRSMPACRDFLRGDRHGAVRRIARSNRVIVSTDLSAASDLLPLDLVKGVVDGLIGGWEELPREWAGALRALTGTQTLIYPDKEEVYSERGILMGLGPTWSILSLIHLVWVRRAFDDVYGHHDGYQNTFSIGGDDLIGFWEPPVVEAYSRIVASCGGKFSSGKHFVSRLGGNFTEITFYQNDRVLPGGYKRSQPIFSSSVPVKGLVGRPPVMVGLAYESLGEHQGLQIRARRVVRRVYPSIWRDIRVTGIPPDLPSVLGGGGLPPIKGSLARVRAFIKHRLALGKYLYGTPDAVHLYGPPGVSRGLDPAQMLAFASAVRRMTDWVLDGTLVVSDRSDGYQATRLTDVVQKMITFYTTRHLYGDKTLRSVPQEVVPLGLRSRLVRSWVSKVIRPGVPSSVAIRDNANSRYALLARLAWLKERLYVCFSPGPVDPQPPT